MAPSLTANQPLSALSSIHADKNGFADGQNHQHHNRTASHMSSKRQTSMQTSQRFQTISIEDKSVFLQRRLAKELGSSTSERASATDYATVVEFIHYERLMALPKEGSAWDKVSNPWYESF